MRRIAVFLAVGLLMAGCGGEEAEKCEPDCEGKVCGDDGCDGVCGECGSGTACAAGLCMATDCLGKQCGPDGWGGSCGFCPDGEVCEALSYLCVDEPPDCKPICEENEYECGPDGCGDVCGVCSVEATYCKSDSHKCEGVCVPACAGLECGPDGCEGNCGECSEDRFCDDGVCLLSNRLPPDDFTVLFGYQGRIPGVNDDEHDLFLVNKEGNNPMFAGTPGPQALTTFSLEGASDCQLIEEEDEEGNPTEYGPCSCKYGCVVDPSLQWIAVSIKKPSALGFTFQLGRFDAQLKVAMVKGKPLKDVVDFKFAGNFLYFTKQYEGSCDGVHCQYQFFRVQLDPMGQIEDLFIFPPDSDDDWPQHSNYKGHFKASLDGSALVILGTTIRSVRIYLWKSGNLHEVDYICNQMVGGQCIGAGSEYTDTDPVAISPDNSKLAAFTIAEKDLRLRLYDTETLQQKQLALFSVPATVPKDTYLAGVCDGLALTGEPWRFKRVVGDPRFSPDGSSIFFISHTDCGMLTPDAKPHTNVLMMDLAAVGDGTAFEESDFVNVTKNPNSDLPENIVIESFAVSASGKTVVLSGTPRYKFVVVDDPLNPMLQPLLPDEKRARKDQEIWLVGASGAGLTQITDDKKFAAKSPLALDSYVLENYNSR